MTSDGEALFRAVCENPADDTPRLVYADWLEENGRPERAEFIRLQCEAWNLCPDYPDEATRRTRASRLLREFRYEWFDELPDPPGVTWSALFVRGFIDAAWMRGSAEVRMFSGRVLPGLRIPPVVELLDRAFAATPLRYLKVQGFTLREFEQLLAHPRVGRLTRLTLPDLTQAQRRLLGEAGGRFPYTEID